MMKLKKKTMKIYQAVTQIALIWPGIPIYVQLFVSIKPVRH